MNCTRLQELAAGYALGALDRADAARLEALMSADPDLREEVESFVAVTRSFWPAVPRMDPPSGVEIGSWPGSAPLPNNAPDPAKPVSGPMPMQGFRFLRPAEGAWSEGLHPGTRFQVLASSIRRNYMMLYMELDPGAVIPAHHHGGDEELFLVSGDLLTEGRHLKAGDFVHSDSGSHHHELKSPGGCQAILLTPLTSALAEAARMALKRASHSVKSRLGL